MNTKKALLSVLFFFLVFPTGGGFSRVLAKKDNPKHDNRSQTTKIHHGAQQTLEKADAPKDQPEEVVPNSQPPLFFLAKETLGSPYKTATLPPQATKDLLIAATSLFGLGLLLLSKIDSLLIPHAKTR